VRTQGYAHQATVHTQKRATHAQGMKSTMCINPRKKRRKKYPCATVSIPAYPTVRNKCMRQKAHQRNHKQARAHTCIRMLPLGINPHACVTGACVCDDTRMSASKSRHTQHLRMRMHFPTYKYPHMCQGSTCVCDRKRTRTPKRRHVNKRACACTLLSKYTHAHVKQTSV
jgi:hypothetical protein